MKARRIRVPNRKHVEGNEARRFATKVSTAIVIIGAVVGLVMVANRWSGHETLQSVRITGRGVLDSAEVISRAMITEGEPLQSLDLAAIEQGIASHPFIEKASVYRGENGTLVVEIVERAPVAATVIDGKLLYIDSTGAILPQRFSRASIDLPLIQGIEAPPQRRRTASMGSAASDSASGRIRLDSAHTAEALEVMKALRSYSDVLYRQVSEVRRNPDGEYNFIMADGGMRVILGELGDLARRLRKLDLFLTSVVAEKGASNIGTVDLRWRGQVVVQWKGNTSQA